MPDTIVFELQYRITTNDSGTMFVPTYVWDVHVTPHLQQQISAPNTGAYLTSCIAEVFRYRIDVGNKKRDDVIVRGVSEGLRNALPHQTFTVTIQDRKSYTGYDWSSGTLTITCTQRPRVPSF